MVAEMPAIHDKTVGTRSVDSPHLQASRAVVLFADIADYDRLLQVDETLHASRVIGLLGQAERELATRSGCTLLQRLGDGLLCRFDAPGAAVGFAHWLHGAASASGVNGEAPLALRVGIHAGELLSGAGVTVGRSINLAERLSKLCQPGQTIASAAVRDAVVDGLDASVEDLGDCYVKHDSPVRAFRLGPTDGGPGRPSGPPDDYTLKLSIAVIPPRPIQCDAEQLVVSDVLADAMIAGLSRVSDLRVISRLTTTRLRDGQHTLADLRSFTGADFIVSGSFSVHGSACSVMLELADAREGSVMWSDHNREPLMQILGGESALVQSAVNAVATAIVAAQVRAVAARPLSSLKAYTLLFGGIALMHRTQRSEFERARDLLHALAERLPRHATPRAWLAAWHVFKVTQGWFEDLRAEAEAAHASAGRALDCDPDDPLALTIHGLVQANLRRDLSLARGSYDRAVEVNPSESLARLHRGTLAAFEDRGAEALDDTAQALRLSPLDPWKYYYDSLGATAALSAGDYERAEMLARRSLRANRTHASTWRALAISCSEQGKPLEARAAIDELLRLDPALTVSGWLARSPSARFDTGRRWAAALRAAGLPP